jgi:cyclase
LKVNALAEDIVVFTGDTYQSVSTAFIQDDDVLLVDGLASTQDVCALREHLEGECGLTVKWVLLTHCMSDHIAGLQLFPEASVVAHKLWMYTYLAQRDRSESDDQQFVRPNIVFGDSLDFRWGRHELRIQHNPGKTVCSVSIDVPTADLVLCGDAVVGNIVYFSGSAPELIGSSLERLRRLGRKHVVPGHMGALPGQALHNAAAYLHNIGSVTSSIWYGALGGEPRARILEIPIEACLAPDVVPSDFEREWHGQNLERIIERRLFALP